MKRLTIFAILLLLLLAACKRGGKPPEITVGTTTCAADQRVIDDLSLAAVARSSDGTVKAFDSAACLLRTIPEGDEWHVWFHDHESANWIEASKAVFVIQRQGLGGPVRHISAFVDRQHARDFYFRTPGRNEIVLEYSTLRNVWSD
jgi:nitrous oxide reductase accessory protein NosL